MAEAGDKSTKPSDAEKAAANQAAIDAAVAAIAAKAKAKPSKPGEPKKAPEHKKADPKAAKGLDFVTEMAPTRKLPILPAVLGVNAVLIAGVVIVVIKLLNTTPDVAPATVTKLDLGNPTTQKAGQGDLAAILADPQASQAPVRTVNVAMPESVSWDQAEDAYAKGQFDDALAQYTALVKRWQKLPADQLVCDFLKLRLGNCLLQMGDIQQSREMYMMISQSRSPVLRASALYQLAALELLDGQHLRARTYAFGALVAAGAAESANLKDFQAQCDYLAARAMTEKAIALWGGQWVAPWKDIPQADPLAGLSEKALRTIINQGVATEMPLTAIIAPVPSTGSPLYAVKCSQTPLEDLLAKFALAAGLDVKWTNVAVNMRQRAVTLNLSGLNPQRLTEIAAAQAGLSARCVGNVVEVQDLSAITDMTQQRLAIAAEAESAWRRFALRYPQDTRVPQGQYALAGLLESQGDLGGAVQEYQLIVTNHRHTKVAPQALYRCAYLRLGTKEYAKARQDLTDLLDLYPDYAALDQVELSLGQASMEEGLNEEAMKILERVYYRQGTAASQAGAALAAAQCQQRLGHHEEAIKWADRFMAADKRTAPATLANADMLLAHSYVATNKPLAAVASLQQALACHAGGTITVEAALMLADVQMSRERFGGALSALAILTNENLTDQQNFQYVLAMLKAYRCSGLSDKALSFARVKLDSVRDPKQSAILQVEQARCQRQAGNLQQAQQLLTTALPQLPQDQVQAATVELADVCFELGKPMQTTALLEGLVKELQNPAARKQAVDVLSKAYLKLGQTDKAAEAYTLLATPEKPAARGTASQPTTEATK